MFKVPFGQAFTRASAPGLLRLDCVSRVVSLVGLSFPAFVSGILMLIVFAIQLGWFPVLGSTSGNASFAERLRTLALPALNLGIIMTAYVMRVTRAAMLNVLAGTGSSGVLAHLAGLLGGGGKVSADQAAAISPDAVQQMTNQAQNHDPSIVDKMSALYAEHPALIKTLGAAAMIIAIRKIAEHASA